MPIKIGIPSCLFNFETVTSTCTSHTFLYKGKFFVTAIVVLLKAFRGLAGRRSAANAVPPHFCLATSGPKWVPSTIFWGPQPDVDHNKLSGHSNIFHFGRYLQLPGP